MKYTSIVYTLGIILTFCIGYITCQKVNSISTLESANSFKMELIEAQSQALDKANLLIDKHNLLDKDGSDDMADFLEYNSRVNHLLDSQL